MTIPVSVEEISDSAFKYCESLKEVVFEAGSALKKIGNDAFRSCKNLKNIQFPDNLETIGNRCFCNSGLEEAVLPMSIRSVESGAFHECK